jgi:hypothetical protein
MSTPDLTNPWDEGGSLASDWSASDAEVLETPAVGDVPVADEQDANGKAVQFLLEQPNSVIQVGITCWAYALASWIPAQELWDFQKSTGLACKGGAGGAPDPDKILKNYSFCTDPRGGLIPDKWPDVAAGERMNWVTANGTRVTPKYIASKLKEKGYLYWSYQPSNANFAHVNVIYGVSYNTKNSAHDCVLVMDPMPNAPPNKWFSDIANIPKNLIAWRGNGIEESSP